MAYTRCFVEESRGSHSSPALLVVSIVDPGELEAAKAEDGFPGENRSDDENVASFRLLALITAIDLMISPLCTSEWAVEDVVGERTAERVEDETATDGEDTEVCFRGERARETGFSSELLPCCATCLVNSMVQVNGMDNQVILYVGISRWLKYVTETEQPRES